MVRVPPVMGWKDEEFGGKMLKVLAQGRCFRCPDYNRHQERKNVGQEPEGERGHTFLRHSVLAK